MGRRYTPKFKFQLVMELLKGDKSRWQLAKAYGVHPNTIGTWMQSFLEKGPEVFAKDGTVAEYERRIGELEQLIGKKEVEIALLKNFMGQTK
ncbi:MAG: transposase [Ardenticatenales bacterium]|nr:transposase [Ardenticatenales bacterium]